MFVSRAHLCKRSFPLGLGLLVCGRVLSSRVIIALHYRCVWNLSHGKACRESEREKGYQIACLKAVSQILNFFYVKELRWDCQWNVDHNSQMLRQGGQYRAKRWFFCAQVYVSVSTHALPFWKNINIAVGLVVIVAELKACCMKWSTATSPCLTDKKACEKVCWKTYYWSTSTTSLNLLLHTYVWL